MKVLLPLTFLLAFLALGLTEPDTDRDLELLRDKREPAGGGKEGRKKSGGKTPTRRNVKNSRKKKDKGYKKEKR